MNKEYCYSWNEENYYGRFKTKEEAIEEARADRPDATYVFIGTCTEPVLKWNSNEESIIESISENLGHDVGEAAENFEVGLDEEKELARMIDETVETWLLQNKIKPSCYAVLDGHRVDISLN